MPRLKLLLAVARRRSAFELFTDVPFAVTSLALCKWTLGNPPWLSSPGKNTLGSCFKYHRCSVKTKPCLLWNTANLGRETGVWCRVFPARVSVTWTKRGEDGGKPGCDRALFRGVCGVTYSQSAQTNLCSGVSSLMLYWLTILMDLCKQTVRRISHHINTLPKKGNSCVPCLQVAWTWTFFCWGGQQCINSNWSVHKVDRASVNSCLVFPVGLRKLVSGA